MHVSHLLLLLSHGRQEEMAACWWREDRLQNERLDAQILAQPSNMQFFYCLSQERGYLYGNAPVSHFLLLSKEVENLEQNEYDWLQMVQFEYSKDRSPFTTSTLAMLQFPISSY